MSALLLELAAIAGASEPPAADAGDSDAVDGDGKPSPPPAALRLTAGERVETLFLLADWATDCVYVFDMATRTTAPLTDRSIRLCLARQLGAISANATAVCASAAAFSGAAAVAACETQTEDFALPLWIVALLCAACLFGMTGDIYRTANIRQTKQAAWRAETDSWGSRREAAEGEVTNLKQAKENSMILCTLLEDGISVGGTVMIESWYVDGPWGPVAQLNVGAAVAALLFKICWALHNRELAQQKLLEPGGLHAAASAGNLKGVKWLVEANGREVDEPAGPNSQNSRDAGWDGTGQTPLISASANGRCDVVAYLLSKGADPNARSADGRTPLTSAAVSCHADVVRLLCTAGASVNAGFTKLGSRRKSTQPELRFENPDLGFAGSAAQRLHEPGTVSRGGVGRQSARDGAGAAVCRCGPAQHGRVPGRAAAHAGLGGDVHDSEWQDAAADGGGRGPCDDGARAEGGGRGRGR